MLNSIMRTYITNYQITSKLKIFVFIKSQIQSIIIVGSTIISPLFCAKLVYVHVHQTSSFYIAVHIAYRQVLHKQENYPCSNNINNNRRKIDNWKLVLSNSYAFGNMHAFIEMFHSGRHYILVDIISSLYIFLGSNEFHFKS